MKPKAIIVDIDGTLANIDHRRHFVDPKLNKNYNAQSINIWAWDDPHYQTQYFHNETKDKFKPDWKSFNEAMIYDTPNEWCVSIVEIFHRVQEFSIIFVTGREACFRKITLNQIDEWISDKNGDPIDYILMMRNEKDYRPDTEIKREIYDKYIKDEHDVLFVIDDRKSVVDMWRSLGLVCLQCAEGNF